MNRTLYDEAVTDAQKLRELAEETAKNKVIEAVMPQIRNLVNKRILGEELEEFDEEFMQSEPAPISDELSVSSIPLDDEPDDDDEAEESSGMNLEIEAEGDVNIHLGESTQEVDLELNEKMTQALKTLIQGTPHKEKEDILEKKISDLETKVEKLKYVLENINTNDLNDSQRKRLNISFLHCVREAFKLRPEVIITEGKTQERLERRLTKTIKEMKNMSKSNRRNIFDFLFEAEEKTSMEELEEAELSLELTDDEQEELADAEDASAVGDALEDILSDLEVSMPAAEDDAEEEEGADEEPEGEEEGEAEEAELDLEEGTYEAHHNELAKRELDKKDEGEMYEIDEAMLRQELAKMMTEDAADEADQFGGGEAEGDVLLDIDEEDLINVLADEIGNTDVPSTPPMVAVESRRARKSGLYRKLSEARRENAQYREAIQNLKAQLVEMNLFNAKLLYANKLMQNTNLTLKQQKSIVEALDNAKTLREAKLLFKSLTESLNRKSSNKLTEGSLRTLGSSSRSTRSAQPASNGVEVDRWGVLAGLHGKD